jgi:threonine/homoserine/homoserine lactone efflux protein
VLSLLVSLLPFAVAASVTPGPNNLMVTASTANFGFRRTIPHMLGITIGFPVMIVGIGWGLGSLFAAFPVLHQILKYVGAAYLLFLSWKIATAGRSDGARGTGNPLTFLQAALFQWVNPKAWVMAISAVTTFTTVGGSLVFETLVIALVFALVCVPSLTTWAVFGLAIGRLLQSDRMRAAFNIAMALLLVASLLPVFF